MYEKYSFSDLRGVRISKGRFLKTQVPRNQVPRNLGPRNLGPRFQVLKNLGPRNQPVKNQVLRNLGRMDQVPRSLGPRDQVPENLGPKSQLVKTLVLLRPPFPNLKRRRMRKRKSFDRNLCMRRSLSVKSPKILRTLVILLLHSF